MYMQYTHIYIYTHTTSIVISYISHFRTWWFAELIAKVHLASTLPS